MWGLIHDREINAVFFGSFKSFKTFERNRGRSVLVAPTPLVCSRKHKCPRLGSRDFTNLKTSVFSKCKDHFEVVVVPGNDSNGEIGEESLPLAIPNQRTAGASALERTPANEIVSCVCHGAPPA